MAIIKPNEISFRRRYNFKKEVWNNFSKDIDNIINSIKPIPDNYKVFNELVKFISRKNIPRGCQTQYITL